MNSLEKRKVLIRIGLNIKHIRQSKNISQKQLAYHCDFEKSNMSRIEAGRSNVTIFTLYKISKALDVDLFRLVILESKDQST